MVRDNNVDKGVERTALTERLYKSKKDVAKVCVRVRVYRGRRRGGEARRRRTGGEGESEREGVRTEGERKREGEREAEGERGIEDA